MRRYTLLLSLTLGLACASAWGARVKDISRPVDARHNQLTGYGIVVGLNGTGDSRQTTFTVQSLSSMLSHFGVQVSPAADQGEERRRGHGHGGSAALPQARRSRGRARCPLSVTPPRSRAAC